MEVSGFTPTLPYYEIRLGLTTDRKTMKIEYSPQELDPKRVRFTCEGIANIQRLYSMLLDYPQILATIPNFDGRDLELFSDAKQRVITAKPNSPLSRIDIVSGKVVDINTKPSGFGLITSAELAWKKEGVYPKDDLAISANYNKLQTSNFDSIAIITESDYPFVSDQIAFSKLATLQTGKPWRIIYCNEVEPNIKDDEGIYCLSWLSSDNVSPKWRNLLFNRPEQFISNPLSGVWDNKALMAIPFLEKDTLNTSLAKTIQRIEKMLPETYLFKIGPEGLVMAVELKESDIEYQKVNKFNSPTIGEVYIKPLLESGARGVVVKNLTDGGTSKTTLLNYSERYNSFIVQKKVEPQKVGGFEIKDGYFIEFQPPFNFITIERMGVKGKTNLIHGGSSSLIPV